MPNIELRGLQDDGKTLGMVVMTIRLIKCMGYLGEEIIGNLHLNIPGTRYKDNEHIKKWIRKVYRESRGEIKHQIILVDEIDGIYSHLDASKETREDLLGLWQDMKLQNFLIYTKHVGKGVNKLVRNATEISIRPSFDRERDTLYLDMINGFIQREYTLPVHPASYYFQFYSRDEPVI